MFELSGTLGQAAYAVFFALAAAFIYTMLGYFKRSETSEVFEGEQFFCSLAVGIIAGIASLWLEISPKDAVTLILADAGLVYMIENAAKAVWRRWLSPWLDKKTAPATTPAP